MSFGLLKHFKDRKKGQETQNQISFVKHLIIGQDLGSVLKLVELVKKYPAESIKLLTNRPINKQNLIENYQLGVSKLRSEKAVTEIYRKHFNAKLFPLVKPTLFYKDGKFHEFGGRAKSMELQRGEDFFIQKGYRLELASFFEENDWNQLDEIINKHIDIRILEGIEKTSPQDLVEKTEWSISFKDYHIMNCENLYVSLSPKKVLNLLKNKEKFSADIIDLGSSVQSQAAISVTWILNKEIYPEERTLFIPQSMTHEWGHFIFEFEVYDHQSKTQVCHGLFLINEEEPQSEDLAAKIKLMKRVFDRVFSDFEKHIQEEFIRFDEEMFISGIKDKSMEQISFDYPTLQFLGQSAPMNSEFSDEKFLARVLLS
jgi:hypothetical protein